MLMTVINPAIERSIRIKNNSEYPKSPVCLGVVSFTISLYTAVYVASAVTSWSSWFHPTNSYVQVSVSCFEGVAGCTMSAAFVPYS